MTSTAYCMSGKVKMVVSISLVLCVALPALFIAMHRYRMRIEHFTIEELELEGAQVERRRAGPAWLRRILGESLTSNWNYATAVSISGDLSSVRRQTRLANRLSALSSASLMVAEVDGECLRTLNELPLRELLLNESTVDDSSICQAALMPGLSTLALGSTRITDLAVRCISKMPNLRDLSVDRCMIGDVSATSIAAMASLEFLNVSRTQITGVGFTRLLSSNTLTYLDCRWCPIDDEGLAVPPRGNHFTVIRLDGTNIGDGCALALRHLEKLDELTVGNTKISDRGLAAICQIGCLRRLDLSGLDIGDDSCKDIIRLSRLETLLVSRTRISSSGLLELSQLPRLKYLDVEGCSISPDEISELMTRNPACHIQQ